MSPRLQAVALTPFERIYNCVTGAMKFSPPPPSERKPAGRTKGAKTSGEMGAVKAVAIRVVDGEITGESYNAIGAEHGVNGDSLKAAVCRERKLREGAA